MAPTINVAIDYDGTIADTNAAKSRWLKVNHGLDVPPWMCNRTDCVPIIGPDLYKQMGRVVYGRQATLAAAPVVGAVEGLRAISHFARIWVVTKRTAEQIGYARDWLGRQGALPYLQGVVSSAQTIKAEICASLGISVLLDDDIRHLEAIQVPGISRFLLRPVEDDRPVPSPIVRVATWPEFVEVVGSAAGQAVPQVAMNRRKAVLIGVDFDGTLADTGAAKQRWALEHASIQVSLGQCSRGRMLAAGMAPEAYDEMLLTVCGRDHTLAAEPCPGALAAVQVLAGLADLCVVTDRGSFERRLDWCRLWLAEHGLAEVFRDLLSTEFAIPGGSQCTKQDICRNNGIAVLVDDDMANLRGLGPVAGIHYGRDGVVGHPRSCRCYSSACPEGELGDVHVSTVLCRISRGRLDELRAAGWDVEGPPPGKLWDNGANRGAAGPPPGPAWRGWPRGGHGVLKVVCDLEALEGIGALAWSAQGAGGQAVGEPLSVPAVEGGRAQAEALGGLAARGAVAACPAGEAQGFLADVVFAVASRLLAGVVEGFGCGATRIAELPGLRHATARTPPGTFIPIASSRLVPAPRALLPMAS